MEINNHMKLYIKMPILMLTLLLILAQCGKSLLSSANLGIPKSDNNLSIYGPDPSSMIPVDTPSLDYNPTIDELFNSDYAYLGIIDYKKTLLVFSKQAGHPVVYSSAIDSIYSQTVSQMYDKRTLLPTYIKTNGNVVEGISINPTFYKADYENLMDTNFSFNADGVLRTGYVTNIANGRYIIKRYLTSGKIGKETEKGISVDSLKEKTIGSGEIWHSVSGISSTTPVGNNNGYNYMFFENNLVALTNGNNNPVAADTNRFKGWNIWQIKPLSEEYSDNYVYVYDYVDLTLETKGDKKVMFLYNKEQTGGVKQAWVALIRLSTNP